MGQKIGVKESSIPHLHTMEQNTPVSNDAAGTAPKIVSKAIPTLVCTRQLLEICT